MNGLSDAEAAVRLKLYGPNEVAREKRTSALMLPIKSSTLPKTRWRCPPSVSWDLTWKSAQP
ncbi:MAG: cation-transporting P-type ATPase [Nitrospirae bacterium]|nr:cation-transporting P-type ATPase [Nitrospirota bacterium]MCL5238804.1 cation-transporting P-type ATPase [Nitrospirota bacterium]